LAAGLSLAGHYTAAFVNPMAALEALDNDRIDDLVTMVQFAVGKPNGIALGRMARVRRHSSRILFTAQPEFAELVRDLGEMLPMPVSVAEVVRAVGGLLTAEGRNSD
jgi:hypothetical protein